MTIILTSASEDDISYITFWFAFRGIFMEVVIIILDLGFFLGIHFMSFTQNIQIIIIRLNYQTDKFIPRSEKKII